MDSLEEFLKESALRQRWKGQLMKFDDWQPTRQTLLHRLKDHEDVTSWQEFFNPYWRFIYSAALHAGL